MKQLQRKQAALTSDQVTDDARLQMLLWSDGQDTRITTLRRQLGKL